MHHYLERHLKLFIEFSYIYGTMLLEKGAACAVFYYNGVNDYG